MGQSTSTPSKPQGWVTVAKKPRRGNLTDDDLKLIEDAYLDAFNLNNDEVLHHLNQEPDQPSTAVPVYSAVEEMLNNNGYFSMKLAPPSEYLQATEAALHPILHFNNFDTKLLGEDRARKAWEEMRPALSLVSAWLSAPEARRRFWHRLMFGVPTTDETGNYYLARSPLEDDFTGASETFSAELDNLAHNLRFYWIPSNTPCGRSSTSQGICFFNLKSIPDRFNKPLHDALRTRSNPAARKYLSAYAPRIGLSTIFLYHLLRPALRRDDRCADMRYQLAIAKTLCHELCHALYKSRLLPNTTEPHVFLRDQVPEVGLSFDFFLGGSRFDLRSGKSFIGRLDARTWQFMLSYPRIGAPVPMEWVGLWFRKDTWEAGREGFREETLWGKAPEAVGVPGPDVFIAHRYAPGNVAGEPGLFKEVLYVERKVVAPVQARGKVDGPGEGVALEEWYAEVSRQEVERARAEGFDEEELVGPWGGYEQSLTRSASERL
ncbi:hypothetical protein P171DRAFT_492444 [Karstenula rhodostoma CBS 690.94]|uniref:Uncharacterized protein n=1 Tax=Karstenula rhodostoma CBS 690.94 TaxID=1392251 RepID=A0A9P4PVH9_9PLEO|nr:hypothetical protein P171DRAFT_492444 [Karstenula rhodostoma CBS 690.94]